MILPHVWCHDQECMDLNRVPLSHRLFIVDNKFYTADKDYVWFKNHTGTPYQLYKQIILVHSEFNSPVIQKLQDHGYVPVHWFSHALIARDWYRFAEHDHKLDKSLGQFDKLFLIYNRAWSGSREYRIKFAEMLVTHNLVDQCQTSFGFVDSNRHYSQHVFSNPEFKPTLELENYFLPNTYDATSSADYNTSDYQNNAIEIVLETIFDDPRNHLTEKSLRPIATGTPFMLVSSPGSLQYLKRYGFETFSPLINEQYDSIADPVQRMQAIAEEMSRIQSLGATQFNEFIIQCLAIAQRNKQRFFSQDFFDQVVNEYRQGMNQAVAECRQNLSLENWENFVAGTQPPGDIGPVLQHFGL